MFLRSCVPQALIGVVLATAAALAQAPAPANDTVKGAALLAEARKALGGDDKLAAIKRLEVKAEFTQVAANQTLDGDVTMQIEGPDKYRRDEEIVLPGGSITIERTLALNGSEAWDVTEGGLPGGFGRGGRGGDFGGRGGGGRLGGILGGAAGDGQGAANAAQQDPARQAALKEQQRRTRQTELTRFLVAFLTATPETPAWVGTAVTPKDEKADVLEFKTADDTITRLFLDIETHVPLMMTYSGPAPRGGQGGGQGGGQRGGGQGGRRGGGDGAAAPGGAAPVAPPAGGVANAPQGARGGAPGQPTTIEMYLGDYKVEGGVKIPRHITREINGEIQEELRIKSVKLNPNFKASTFVQPKP